MPKREKDTFTESAEMVRKVTRTRKPRANELLPPELAKKLAALKKADKARQSWKRP
jgi:hypothetical protein